MGSVRTRRAVLCVGAALMALPCRAVATAGSLAGRLLVATPEMRDPRFARTVLLMVRDDETGALGVAINRPTRQVPIAELLRALALDAEGADGNVMLFAGGPVEPRVGLIVHSAEYRRPTTLAIDGRTAMTSDPAVLRDIGRSAGPRQYLVAFGYAGWGPGQLQAEIDADAWFTIPEEPQLVFDLERDKLWDEATRRRTVPL
jgi:putative transcriptional regulator